MPFFEARRFEMLDTISDMHYVLNLPSLNSHVPKIYTNIFSYTCLKCLVTLTVYVIVYQTINSASDLNLKVNVFVDNVLMQVLTVWWLWLLVIWLKGNTTATSNTHIPLPFSFSSVSNHHCKGYNPWHICPIPVWFHVLLKVVSLKLLKLYQIIMWKYHTKMNTIVKGRVSMLRNSVTLNQLG